MVCHTLVFFIKRKEQHIYSRLDKYQTFEAARDLMVKGVIFLKHIVSELR